MLMKIFFCLYACFLLIPLFFSYVTAENNPALKVGDPAPSFMANDQNGNLWKSSDYIGKGNLIIYFYPIAMTGG